MANNRIPLYYTFGNHMHWVDMEWLWGYDVLPGSVRDMLYFCAETGAKGNINFDGIGYEKMAVETPEALTELRGVLKRGQIEVVGASYGQPYGLFHGGESNVRQRIYGVRAVMRLLGVRPRTFWEEEFDFFPQLPQMLKGVGLEYASLFFQWTWHTPLLPQEEVSAIWWEGMDGSRLLAAPRSPLNLHQWPEDFANLLESPLLRRMPTPAIVQWLELMPSPDWMCRAELILPPLRDLMNHPTFEVRFVTLSEYLEIARQHALPRRYTLDDVFHGMSLGKNGDLFRRLSRAGEHSILTAESISAMVGFFGRPYPGWDVYPVWELEEAWRELLSAQHHDNDECEGLCGFVGKRSYELSIGLASHITRRTTRQLADRTSGPPGRTVVYNPLGWSRDAVLSDPSSGEDIVVKAIPPFGYHVIGAEDRANAAPPVKVEEDARNISLQRGALKVAVDRSSGLMTQLASTQFPNGALREDTPLTALEMKRGGKIERFRDARVAVGGTRRRPTIQVERRSQDGAKITVGIGIAPELDAVDITYIAESLPRPDFGMHASLQTTLALNLPKVRLIHDHPYGVSEIHAEGTYLRKYPTGDWMTSPQVFEEVYNPFTALGLLDFDGEGRGLLYLHDGSQAMLRDGERVRNILSMYDPWDEDYFIDTLNVRARLVPHGPISNAQRWKLAQEFTRPVLVEKSRKPGGNLPPQFGSLWCDAAGVAVSAFYRESAPSGQHLDRYAGVGVGFPYVLRIVELNGEAVTARLRVPGPVATAFRTNLLGEKIEEITTTPASAPIPAAWEWHELALRLRPYEIATVYLDLVPGRKVGRNLDDYRYVWATVHRVE